MTDPSDIDFEKTIEELEGIVARLEREDVDLDEAIGLFKRGLERVQAANAWLEQASGQVEELIESSSGALETRPFEGGGESGE